MYNYKAKATRNSVDIFREMFYESKNLTFT